MMVEEDGVRDAGENGQTPILEVDDLAYRYGSTEVFSDVSFALPPGSITYLIGPNGAGKSTLFRCLAGWSLPSEGMMRLCGRTFDGSNREQRKLVSFVPDVPSFYDDLTAVEHIRFMQRANRVSPEESDADRLLEAFGLSFYGDRFPSSYSRGMRQKLALVLALSVRPQLLLLDEPYGPLDRQASVTLSGMLAAARDRGASVLASCHHDVPDLKPDQVLHLDLGSLERTE